MSTVPLWDTSTRQPIVLPRSCFDKHSWFNAISIRWQGLVGEWVFSSLNEFVCCQLKWAYCDVLAHCHFSTTWCMFVISLVVSLLSSIHIPFVFIFFIVARITDSSLRGERRGSWTQLGAWLETVCWATDSDLKPKLQLLLLFPRAHQTNHKQNQ